MARVEAIPEALLDGTLETTPEAILEVTLEVMLEAILVIPGKVNGSDAAMSEVMTLPSHLINVCWGLIMFVSASLERPDKSLLFLWIWK